MLQTVRRKRIQIGPDDDGRRMSLDEFDLAIGRPGYVYELTKGVIDVSEIPSPEHAKQVQAVRNQLVLYQEKHPGVIDLVAGSNESKLLIASSQSERHPNLSVYIEYATGRWGCLVCLDSCHRS